VVGKDDEVPILPPALGNEIQHRVSLVRADIARFIGFSEPRCRQNMAKAQGYAETVRIVRGGRRGQHRIDLAGGDSLQDPSQFGP
jgi:hypothetical protein